MRSAEFSFLQIVGDWSDDSAKSFDELMIEGNEPVKTPHVMNGLRLSLFLNGSDFLRIRRNSISRDYKSED